MNETFRNLTYTEIKIRLFEYMQKLRIDGLVVPEREIRAAGDRVPSAGANRACAGAAVRGTARSLRLRVSAKKLVSLSDHPSVDPRR